MATSRIVTVGLWCLLGVVLILTVVPIAPEMPVPGLDPSWRFGMAEAVAQGLVFGREVIFTFGPYAGAFTLIYHPDIFHLSLIAAGLVSISILVSVWLLIRAQTNQTRILVAVLLAFVASDLEHDAAFFFIIWLTLAALAMGRAEDMTLRNVMGSALICAVLPLIKISFVPLVAVCVLFAVIRLARQGGAVPAAGFVGIQAVLFVALWVVSGQPVDAIAPYVTNGLEIVKGYTAAMSLKDGNTPIMRFVVTGVWLIGVIYLLTPGTKWQKLALCFATFCVLFIVNKAAFVRHDGHAVISVTTIFAMTLVVWAMGRWRSIFAGVLLLFTFGNFEGQQGRYDGADQGLVTRLFHPARAVVENPLAFQSGKLQQAFAQSVAELAAPFGTDTRSWGRADLLSYDQGNLIATEAEWAPRPILQSYSAYTPKLAMLNAGHFAQADRPDTVLLALTPIDGRYPTSEDGPAVARILAGYAPADRVDDYLVLRRNDRADVSENDVLGDPAEIQTTTDAWIDVPADIGPVFLRIEMQETVADKFWSLAFKNGQFTMSAMIEGEELEFRHVPALSEAGHILSPFIEDTDALSRWIKGDTLPDVQRIKINSQIGTRALDVHFYPLK